MTETIFNNMKKIVGQMYIHKTIFRLIVTGNDISAALKKVLVLKCTTKRFSILLMFKKVKIPTYMIICPRDLEYHNSYQGKTKIIRYLQNIFIIKLWDSNKY